MAFIPQGCVSHWDKALEDILSLGWNRARAVPAGSLSQDGTFPALPAGIVRSTDETEVSVPAYLEHWPARSALNRLHQAHQTQRHPVLAVSQL